MLTLHPGRRGFSLLEIVVVLVLIGVAAAVVMPSFVRGLKGLELETSGRDLITRMKNARSQAIANQKVFRIILNQSSEGSFFYSFTNEYGEEIEQFPFAEGISTITENTEWPLIISFYSNGRSSGATFILKNQQGKRMSIEVDPITGFARTIDGAAQ
ncbi:MAG: prepilin-type N-terminal cleavage/methylation domain-containing protein [Acidobacteriota bacterium]